MKAVYYSLAASGHHPCEQQWIHSVRSLRFYNPQIPVLLITWDNVCAETLAVAARLSVRVIDAGPYNRCFAHLPRVQAEVLCLNRTLHKIPALSYLPTDKIDQLLYLDCDTFFFDDVEALFAQYGGPHFVAREEPLTRRSHYGYNPGYIDEYALAALACRQGLLCIPPYNTGVFLMNSGLSGNLQTLAAEYLVFAWRLTVGLQFGSQLGASLTPQVAALLDQRVNRDDDILGLPYPSSNAWIIEEIALWLTLGRIDGLSHDTFDRTHVVQNGEILEIGTRPRLRPIIAHYFSSWEEMFFDKLRSL